MGKVIGVASAFAAAAVFGISQAPEIRRTFFWRDSVEVLSIDPFNNTVVLSNSGDGTVYVSSISFNVESLTVTKNVSLNMYSLGTEIESKRTKTVPLLQSANEDGKKSFALKPLPIPLDGTQWLDAHRNSGNKIEVATGAKCFLQLFTLKSSEYLSYARDAAIYYGTNDILPGIRTYPVSGTLNFQSVERQRVYAEPVLTVGILLATDKQGC